MALFTERDRSMLEINQFLQLEFQEPLEGSELHVWVDRRMFGFNTGHLYDAGGVAEQRLKPLAALWWPVRSIFAGIASSGEISQEAIFTFNRCLERQPSPAIVGEYMMTISSGIGMPVKAENIDFVVNLPGAPGYWRIEEAILNQAQEALKERREGRKVIRECPICRNPFVARVNRQEWCSLRCRNRAANRRFKSKNKSTEQICILLQNV